MIMYVTTVYNTNLGHGAAATAHTTDQMWCTVCTTDYEQCASYAANCGQIIVYPKYCNRVVCSVAANRMLCGRAKTELSFA